MTLTSAQVEDLVETLAALSTRNVEIARLGEAITRQVVQLITLCTHQAKAGADALKVLERSCDPPAGAAEAK